MAKNVLVDQRKRDQLGMPIGTAMGRLRKMFLLSLAKQAGRDSCIRCGKAIENVAEMSLDHIEPWLYEDTDKFWDLDNVGLSHSRCNVGHSRRRQDGIWRQSPPGKHWCTKCLQFLDKSMFSKHSNKASGLNDFCYGCRKNSGWKW